MKKLNNSPLISVIMGVYNDEKFLSDAIESVLSQTFQEFEFIICNDCSTDESLPIIKKYMEKDERIILLNNNKNLGLAYSLNQCLEVARGVYIARMDSDDICFPDRLEKELSYMQSHPLCDVLGTSALIIDNQNNVVREFKKFKLELNLRDCLRESSLIHPSVMMKKSAINSVQGYSVNSLTKRAEDYDLWCKLVSNGFVLNNINEILLYYREDLSGLKKRKYKYRIQEFKIKFYWNKKQKYLIVNLPYIVKPLIVGLLPKKLLLRLRK